MQLLLKGNYLPVPSFHLFGNVPGLNILLQRCGFYTERCKPVAIDNPAAGKLDKIDFVEKYELININPGEITDYSVRKDKVVFIIFNGGNTSEMEGYYGAYFSMKDNKMHDITFTPAMKFNKDKSVLEVFEPTSPYPYPEGKDVTYDLDKL